MDLRGLQLFPPKDGPSFLPLTLGWPQDVVSGLQVCAVSKPVSGNLRAPGFPLVFLPRCEYKTRAAS